MSFELLDVTLPVEVSNDPKLLKDLELWFDGKPLPLRVRILENAVSIGFGKHVWFIRLKRL